jgi:hypothetical protein
MTFGGILLPEVNPAFSIKRQRHTPPQAAGYCSKNKLVRDNRIRMRIPKNRCTLNMVHIAIIKIRG